jgi:hypothetical protein
MKTLALAAALAFAAPAAQAGTWTTKWTGPHGGVYEGGGACENGACKAAGTFTGPFGGVWKHAGTAHKTGAGWEGAGDVTGPNGQIFHHQWSWSGNGG